MTLVEEIDALRRERHAVLLAHNYQVARVQEIADFVGDSLYLSRKAAETDAEVIVFAGVRFMAETAKILSPTKTVLLPDLAAGCSLADSITVDELKAWKREHPGAVVVSYVNTSAEVKAESDFCCTSSNAVKIVQQIPADREILFLPDLFLGEYVRRQTGRAIHVWAGDCFVHSRMRPADVERARHLHPGAEVIAHPECGCSTAALPLVDRILSTDGMVRYAKETRAPEVLVATEVGILPRMRSLNAGTKFTALSEAAICPFMKQVDLADIRDSLRLNQYVVDVPPETAQRARRAIDRMIAA